MQFTISLPDGLGHRAQANGLLKEEAVITMFEIALRRVAAERFLAVAPTGDDATMPQLSDKAIVDEVKRVRAARKKAAP